MTGTDLIPHLFRTEYRKLVAVLTKRFGIANLETIEDIASETFLSALDSWPYKGVPANPVAWLHQVAKNKLTNHLARNHNFQRKVAAQLSVDTSDEPIIDFSDTNISDSQLQMLFAVCHPSISTEAQICLALRTLCGLGLDEIANAFLSNKETIHKRLQRSRKKLCSEQVRIEMPDAGEIQQRLETVLQTIYLLFSEGYYSESHPSIVRQEFCIEALNLAYLLLEHASTNTHSTNALLSLMCFQSSRLEARRTENGALILYKDQDRELWDTAFIEKGFYYLQQASRWEITSKYYLEASIAYWHTIDDNHPEKWACILKLYDGLLCTHYSPVAALNRIWAFSKVYGDVAAIGEAQRLDFKTNHFYFVLLAELYAHVDATQSMESLTRALHLCKTPPEKAMIRQKMEAIKERQSGNS